MNLFLDAGFLIGLYDERDQHHQRSKRIFAQLFEEQRYNKAVIVWPALYEAVSTQMVRSRFRLEAMERDWRILLSARRLLFMDDTPYREDSLEECFGELGKPLTSYRDLSLTDRVIRALLADPNVRVDAILTFNERDFVDVCQKYNRRIVS